MRQVRIELTTLGLWDLRAANCATAAYLQRVLNERPEQFITVNSLSAKVIPRGLEPRTLRLLAVRSNQLSYETMSSLALVVARL